jgi:hypothetical protein
VAGRDAGPPPSPDAAGAIDADVAPADTAPSDRSAGDGSAELGPEVAPPDASSVDVAPDGPPLESCAGTSYYKRRCVGTVSQGCGTGLAGAWHPDVDCASAGGSCFEGRCFGGCTPGESYCATVLEERACGANGQWVSRGCPVGCARGRCFPCQSGALQCRGNVVQTCNTTVYPYAWTDGAACAGTCTGGYCDGVGCTTGKRRCDGTHVQTCDASGQWVGTSECARFCYNGACNDSECASGDKECVSASAHRVCTSGTWQPATACAAGSTCADGTCPDCVAPAKRCNGTSIETCAGDGTWTRQQTCSFVCSAAGTCTGECVPGTNRCRSDKITPQHCDDTGHWIDQAPCVNQTCVAGACQGACTPVQEKCVSGTLQKCVDGGWATKEVCASGCLDGTRCACTPGAASRCLGNTPRLCTTAGAWEDGDVCGSCTGAGSCCHSDCQTLVCDILTGPQCIGSYSACAAPVLRCTTGARRCKPHTNTNCDSASARTAEVCDLSRTWVTAEVCGAQCTGAGVCSP